MNSCETCLHYRPCRRPSEILSLATLGEGGLMTQQLQREQADQALHHGFVNAQQHLSRAEQTDQLSGRPIAFAHCGIDEDEGVYRACEIKNRDGDCPHHTDTQPAMSSCASCVFRCKGPKYAQWEQEMDNLRTAIPQTISVAAGTFTTAGDPQTAMGPIQALIRYREMGTAAEAAVALANPDRPYNGGWYDSCSRHGKRVLCILWNRDDRCSKHITSPTFAIMVRVRTFVIFALLALTVQRCFL